MNFKKIHESLRPQLAWVITFILAMLVSLGCSDKHSKLAARANEIKAFDQEEDKLFAPYMTGNVEQARQSLNQTIQHLKESNALDPHAQSGRLSLDYARLYALEKRTGNKADAEVALIKARYWRIRNMEPPESLDDEAIVNIMSATPEQVMKVVDTFDAGDNGNRPKYLQYITNSPS